MKTVSLLDFRHHAERILAQVQRGERMILTRRGKPVARLEPIIAASVDAGDPFYAIDQLATPDGTSLSNRQIDEILYGQ